MQPAPISALIRTGGIFYDIDATEKRDVLRALVDRLPLPPDHDRETLLTALEAREAMGATGIGDGIAIPHVRNPAALGVEDGFVTLCLLQHAIAFGAIDGAPVHALFMVISPKVHLRILGQLGFLLRDSVLRAMLRERAPAEDIIGRIELVEATRTSESPRPALPKQ